MTHAIARIRKTAHLLWSADRILARLWMRRLLAQAMASGTAAAGALVGFAFLELAAFLRISESASPAVAAASMGAANLVLASIAFLVATRARKPSPEAAAASEAHDISWQLLVAEFESLPAEALMRLIERLTGLLKKKSGESRET